MRGRCAFAATSRWRTASSGRATIIGTKRQASADLAAFANCAAVRYLDLNDAYVGHITGHPSDNISACLAVAEAERASAAELITAVALAYGVNCRLIDAFDTNSRGWDLPVLSLPAVAFVRSHPKLDLLIALRGYVFDDADEFRRAAHCRRR
jgi:2-methylcitrate dehydratase